jgi:hypothetical protein
MYNEDELEDDKDPLVFDVTLLYVALRTGSSSDVKPTISMTRNYTYVVDIVDQLNAALKEEPATIIMVGETLWLDDVKIVERAYNG